MKLIDSSSNSNSNFDFSVELTGTILGNSTYTIYNKDIDTSLLNDLSLIKDGSSAISDLYLNGITTINESDSIELLHNGEIVDLFDPTDGKDAYSNYSALKKYIRKGGKGVSTSWNDLDWILYGITGTTDDDDSVGNHENELNAEAMNFTYFAFEQDFSSPIVGLINNSTKTINITLPEGTDATSLNPVFGISGKVNLGVKKSNHEFICTMDWNLPEINSAGNFKTICQRFRHVCNG